MNRPDIQILWERACSRSVSPVTHTVARELAPARLRSSRRTDPGGLPGEMRGPASQASGSKLPRHIGLVWSRKSAIDTSPCGSKARSHIYFIPGTKKRRSMRRLFYPPISGGRPVPFRHDRPVPGDHVHPNHDPSHPGLGHPNHRDSDGTSTPPVVASNSVGLAGSSAVPSNSAAPVGNTAGRNSHAELSNNSRRCNRQAPVRCTPRSGSKNLRRSKARKPKESNRETQGAAVVDTWRPPGPRMGHISDADGRQSTLGD